MNRIAETLTAMLMTSTLVAPLHAQTTATAAPTAPVTVVTTPVSPLPSARGSLPPLPGQGSPARLFANSRYYVQQYQEVQSFGRCAVHIGREPVVTLLEAAPNTANERFQLRFVGARNKACLPYGYTAPVIFLRGALAEALYRSQPAALTVPSAGSPARLEAAFQAAEQRRNGARLIDDLRYSTLSNCVVARAPLQVRRLLFSEHGSLEERAALESVL